VPVALRTPRLLLREWRDEDAEPFAALSANPDVMRHLLPLLGPDEIEAWIARAHQHWDEHGFGPWVVELPGDARFIGMIGLNRIRWTLPFTPAVEAAWRLARPYWGKGYAVEAARAVTRAGATRR